MANLVFTISGKKIEGADLRRKVADMVLKYA